ncbi:hypothetical protein [Bacillus sp. UNCCL81]|uniref:hypothetical protein n=1 Tax=Bacillus sp. UNCCL81 TaxID=1502755 RepID=UPI000B858F50|nr:hypothetical protein [Bacillus sp. UNCCL81]
MFLGDSLFKNEVENKANELDILEWRTSSYFEGTFVAVENAKLASHFFELNKNTFSFEKEFILSNKYKDWRFYKGIQWVKLFFA